VPRPPNRDQGECGDPRLDADQTTVVVLMNDPGEQVVDLVGGYYFLNVAIAVPKGSWTATVTPVN
jgi:hypothetical protein